MTENTTFDGAVPVEMCMCYTGLIAMGGHSSPPVPRIRGANGTVRISSPLLKDVLKMVRACSRRSWCFLLLLAALVVAGCRPSASTEKAKEAPRVTVAHPTVRSLVDEDDYSGWLEASQTVELRARVRGHIKKIHFQDGDLVQQGQLLFELDPRPFQVAIDEALADVNMLKAQQVAADANAARAVSLFKSNAMSASDKEQLVAEAQSYGARIAAKMQVVEKCKLDLEFSRITAPIAGRISKAELTEGNLVNAGGSDPLLTTIVAIDPIYVDFNVDERAMQGYQGMKVDPQAKDKQNTVREQEHSFFLRPGYGEGVSASGSSRFRRQ